MVKKIEHWGARVTQLIVYAQFIIHISNLHLYDIITI